MNYGKINTCDIANGPGVRVSLFVSGCRNHCKGCFNPETWDFGYGQPFTDHTMDSLIGIIMTWKKVTIVVVMSIESLMLLMTCHRKKQAKRLKELLMKSLL